MNTIFRGDANENVSVALCEIVRTHHKKKSKSCQSFQLVIYKNLDEPVVVVVALLFYVHGKHLRSCRDGQLT